MARTGLLNQLAFFAALAASYSCGGTTANTRPTTGTTTTTAAASDAGAATPGAGPSEVVVAPRVEEPWVAQRDADGTQWVVMGSLRGRVTESEVAWADDAFTASIVAASPVQNGWVFVARDGAVARADSFVGALHRLGNIPRALDPSQDGRGRVAVLDDRGTVWQTDGSAPVAEASGLPEGRCLSVIFSDARRGVAVMDGGRALRTDDGGQSWHALDLGGDAAFKAVLSGGRIHLLTTGGARALGDDGTPGAPSPDRPAEDEGFVERSDWPRLRMSAVRKFPVLLATHGSGTWAARADGNYLLADPNGTDAHVIDPVSGAEVRTLSGVIPSACAASRVFPRWGNGVGFACTRDDGTVALYRVTDADAFEPAAPDGFNAEGVVLSDDGVHAARQGPCGQSESGDSSGTLCVRGDNGQWRTVTVEQTIASLIDMHGGDLLVRAANSADEEASEKVIHTDSGQVVPLRISRRDGMPRVELRTVAFTSDGRVYGLGVQEQGSPSLLMGDPAQPLPGIALPTGAWGVGFADSQRGMAAGVNLSKLWRTTDGGRSWTPVPVHLDGSAETVSLRGEWARSIDVRCDPRGCTVADVLRVRGWDTPRDAPASVIAATERAPERMERQVLDDAGLHFNRLGCEAQGRPANSPRIPNGPAPTRAHPRHVSLGAGGVTGRLDAWNDPQHGWTYQLSWRGEDARGAYTSASRAAALPVTQPELDAQDAAASGEGAGYVLRGATRQLALLERCRRQYDETHCELIAVPAGAEPALVRERTDLESAVDSSGYVANTVATDDGGILALVAVYGRRFAVHQVLVFGPDGRVRGRRTFAWDAQYTPPVYAVGRYRNQAGYVVVWPAEPQVFRFYPLGSNIDAQPIDLPRLHPGAVGLCRAPRTSDAAEVTTTISAYLPSLDLPESSWAEDVRATVEVSPAGECLRSVESWVPSGSLEAPERWAGFGLRLAAGADGALAGARDDGAHRQPLHCH